MARSDDRRDSLTGLASRGRLERILSRRCGRIGDACAGDTVVLIDIVGLKEVNRGQGFLIGDDMIKRVAARLSRLSRGDAVIGRLGGDEFLAIFRPKHASIARWFASSLLRLRATPTVRVATTTLRPRDNARRVIARVDAILRAERDTPRDRTAEDAGRHDRELATRLDDMPRVRE